MLDLRPEALAQALESQQDMVDEALQIENYSEQLSKLGGVCVGGVMGFSAVKKPTRREKFEMNKIRLLLAA